MTGTPSATASPVEPTPHVVVPPGRPILRAARLHPGGHLRVAIAGLAAGVSEVAVTDGTQHFPGTVVPGIPSDPDLVQVDLDLGAAYRALVPGRWRLVELRDGALADIGGDTAGLRPRRFEADGETYEVECSAKRAVTRVQVRRAAQEAALRRLEVRGGALIFTIEAPDDVRRCVARERSSGDLVELRRTGAAVFELRVEDLPARDGTWMLQVQDGPGAPLRVGAHIDGLAGRKPAAHHVWLEGETRRIRPHITQNGWVGVRARALEPVEGPSTTPTWSSPGEERKADERGPNPLWRAMFAVIAYACRLWRVVAPRPQDGPVTFLLLDAFGKGGTMSTVIGQANALHAAGVETRVVSIRRRTPKPPIYDVDRGVGLEDLVDEAAHDRHMASGGNWKDRLRDRLLRQPSAMQHEDERLYHSFSIWHDLKILRFLLTCRSGYLIGTRAGINTAIARFAHPGAFRIGQEHVPVAVAYTDRFRKEHIQVHYPRLHALGALNPVEAEMLARLVAADTEVRVIPNPIPAGPYLVSTVDEPVIVSGGRLTKDKQFDVLIDAFGRIADEAPDWRLVIHGTGPRRDALGEHVHQLGLAGRVFLPGFSASLPAEMGGASIFALASRFEAFPMVLLEAQRSGLPVVTFDCPTGPAAIVNDGADGYLVPNGDVDALAARLATLVHDRELRVRMGRAGRQNARRFAPDAIADAWRTLFGDVRRRFGA